MNKNLALWIPLGVACVIVVASSIAQGIWTDRFGARKDADVVLEFSQRLEPIPKVIGDWEAVDHAMNAQEQEVAGIVGYIQRDYRNNRTNESVTVMLVCGHSRNIAKHEPTQCYVAAGFTQEKDEDPYAKNVADETTASFNTTVFKREEPQFERLRVFWSWNYEGQWVAPSMARWTLRGQPALYKLYVINNVGQGEDIDQGAALRFINEFIPVANQHLFPKDAAPAAPAENASSGSDAAPSA